MRIRIAILYLVISTSICNAQNDGYLSISAGASIPTGAFGSLRISSSKSGLAMKGKIFEISFGGKLSQNFGLTAMIHWESEPVYNTSILDYYTNRYPNYTWNIETSSWSTGGFLGGAYLTFPVWKEKISLNFRGMIGFLRASSPDLTITSSLGNISAWEKQTTATAGGFSYLLGSGFKYNLSKSICLLISCDYICSSFQFDYVDISTNFGYSDIGWFKQDFSTVGVAAGVGIRM